MSLSAALPKVHRILGLREHRVRTAAAGVEACRRELHVAREALDRRERDLERNRTDANAVRAWLDSPRSGDLGEAPLRRLEVLSEERRAALSARIHELEAVAKAEERLEGALEQLRRARARLIAVEAWTDRLRRTLGRESERRQQLEQENWLPSTRGRP